MTRRFANRHPAGRELGERLSSTGERGTGVLGLACGAVPVAYEVARALGAPPEVLGVRKIGALGKPELGTGAVPEGGVRVLVHGTVRRLLVGHEGLEAATARAGAEVDARVERYRGERRPIDVKGRTAIIVDDGLATGGTAALRAVRAQAPRRVTLAVPVGAPDVVQLLRGGRRPGGMPAPAGAAVRSWTLTRAFRAELGGRDRGAAPRGARRSAAAPSKRSLEVGSPAIVGDLVLLERPGAWCSRTWQWPEPVQSRNRQVARALKERRLATLLLDLLSRGEERDRANVLDVALLSRGLVAAAAWARAQPNLTVFPIGYPARASALRPALWAAAELGETVGVVVSRGGRPDLVLLRVWWGDGARSLDRGW